LDLDAGKEPTLVITLVFDKEMTGPPKEQVGVPVPDGAEVVWAGEVMSSDPNEDVTATDLETVEIDGQTYAVFTVTKSSQVQVECTVPEDILTGDAKRSEIDLKWTTPSDMTVLQLAVLAPPGSRAEEVPEDVETIPISTGTAYVRNFKDIEADTEATLQLALVPGEPDLSGLETTGTVPATESVAPTVPANATGSDAGGSSWVPYIIGGLLALMALAIGALVVIQRRQTPAE
jgi:hypothetical protein